MAPSGRVEELIGADALSWRNVRGERRRHESGRPGGDRLREDLRPVLLRREEPGEPHRQGRFLLGQLDQRDRALLRGQLGQLVEPAPPLPLALWRYPGACHRIVHSP